jgi:hypothetical protein
MSRPVKKTHAEKQFEPLQKIYDDVNSTWKNRKYADIVYLRALDGLIQKLTTTKINSMADEMDRLRWRAAALRETIRTAPPPRPQTQPPPPQTQPPPPQTPPPPPRTQPPPPRTQPDFLTRLGLTDAATIENLRKAFKDLALLKHPDKPGGHHDAFVRLQNDKDMAERFISVRGIRG